LDLRQNILAIEGDRREMLGWVEVENARHSWAAD
jgi:hypothetical protein